MRIGENTEYLSGDAKLMAVRKTDGINPVRLVF